MTKTEEAIIFLEWKLAHERDTSKAKEMSDCIDALKRSKLGLHGRAKL